MLYLGPIYDFGRRRDTPCGDCDERGHCTMNCGPPITMESDDMGPFVCVPFNLMTEETIHQIIEAAKPSTEPPIIMMVTVLERELAERRMKAAGHKPKGKGGK